MAPKTPKPVAVVPINAAPAPAAPTSVIDPKWPPASGKVLSEADSLADLMGEPRPSALPVKIKLLGDSAKVPTYGTDGAACFDLYAADTVAIAPGRATTVKTDVAFEVPEGYVMMVYSRSGHGYKHGVRLVNSVGVIDSDYRGEVVARLHNDGRDTYVVELGERVAQAMIVPVPRVEFQVVEELSATGRGEGGFGSTGK